MCVGCLGWSPDTFWDAMYFEVVLAVYGYAKHLDNAQRNQWEMTRFLATVIAAPNLKKGVKPDARSLFPLIWDKKKSEIRELPRITKKQMVGQERLHRAKLATMQVVRDRLDKAKQDSNGII